MLHDCGVTPDELLDLVDASAAGGEEVTDTRLTDPATGAAARLPDMWVWWAEEGEPGPDLQANFKLPGLPGATITNVRGHYELKLPGVIPLSLAVSLRGERLSELVSHKWLNACDIRIIACRTEDSHSVFGIVMPLVPLFEAAHS